MISLQGVSKEYPTRRGTKTVLDNVNLQIGMGEKMGILGSNGAGKSTLIRVISGVEFPTKGKIERSMSVSWPLAFAGGFQSALTGLDNLRFICRVYGVPVGEKLEFVKDFSELGKELYEPVRTYSAGMRMKLAFATSLSIEFDCFLIDEVVAVGDAHFQKKCHIELFEKRKDRALIFVSHLPHLVAEYCHSASVLAGGRLHQFAKLDDAFSFYNDDSDLQRSKTSSGS